MNQRLNIITRWLWLGFKLILGLAVVGGALYWIKFSPMDVSTEQVEQGEIIEEAMGTGTLEARVKVSRQSKNLWSTSRNSGRSGRSGLAGDPLVKLDDEEL